MSKHSLSPPPMGEDDSGVFRALSPPRETPDSTSDPVDQLERRIRSAPQEDSPRLLEEVRTTLARLRQSTGVPPAAESRLLTLLLDLSRRTGKLPSARQELNRAATLAQDDAHRLLELAALRCDLEMQEGHYEAAESALREGLERGADLPDEQRGRLLLKLGQVLIHRERYLQAGKLLASVLPVLEGGSHGALAADCRFHLGNLALRRGRHRAAAGHHNQALAVRRGLGAPHPTCASLCALGAVARASGNYPKALEWLRQAEAEARRAGELADLAYAEYGLGRVLGRLGDHASAAGKLRSSLDLRRQIGDREGQALSQIAVAENTLELGQPRPAMKEAQEAAFHLSLLSPSGMVGDAEQLLGRIHLAQKNATEARRHFRTARELHEKHGDVITVIFDQAWLLRVALDWPVRETLEDLVEEIAHFLEGNPYPDLGERLDFTLYQALTALAERGEIGGRIENRRQYLERAYNAILQKTQHLDPELRHRFLFQIPENDAILKTAAQQGVGDGGLRPN